MFMHYICTFLEFQRQIPYLASVKQLFKDKETTLKQYIEGCNVKGENKKTRSGNSWFFYFNCKL